MIKSSKGERKEKNTGDGEKYIYACGGKRPGIRPMLGPDGKVELNRARICTRFFICDIYVDT